MKKTPIYVLLLTAFFVLALTGCGKGASGENGEVIVYNWGCLLYTSPSPRDA